MAMQAVGSRNQHLNVKLCRVILKKRARTELQSLAVCVAKVVSFRALERAGDRSSQANEPLSFFFSSSPRQCWINGAV